MQTNVSFGEQVINDRFSHLVEQSVQNLLNYKLLCIKSIMQKRFLMGYNNDGKMFDKLYDMDIDQLELFEMEYEEQCIRYIDSKKRRNDAV